MAERAGVAVPAVRQVIKTADGSAVLAMDRVDGRSLDLIPARRVDDAMIRAAVDAGRCAAPGQDRAPVAAGGQHRGRWHGPALDRGLQLRRAGRHATPDRARRRRAAGLAGRHRRRRPGRRRRGRRDRPGPGCRRGAVAAAAGAVRWHPPRDRPPGRPADPDQAGRRRRQRPHGHRTGPPPAGPPQDAACGRRGRGGVLLPAARAGQGAKQLAGGAVGRLGLGAAGHRLVGGDLPGQRDRAHGRDLAADPAVADRPGPGRVVVHQPGVPGQRRRHGAERPVPAEVGRGAQPRASPRSA